MQRDDVMHVLNDPLAQELIGSNISARVAYTSVDGTPRAVQRCWSSSRWLTLRLRHAAASSASYRQKRIARSRYQAIASRQ